ncbi:MAG: arylsulfotransferase family protein [bacterium]
MILNNDNEPEEKKFLKWHAASAWLGLCFLCLVWGGISVQHGCFPGHLLRDAYEGAKAARASVHYWRMRYSADLWSTNRFKGSGVTVHDPVKACAGYTLYTSGHVQGAILIDMDGKVVHEWTLPYDRIWDSSGEVKSPRPPHQIFWFKAKVFPNGDLMAVVEGNGGTPWGQGIIKIDRDSRLIWKFLGNAHHDFTIGDDGRIYGLTHQIRTEPFPGLNLDYPCLEDYLVILSPDGKKLDEISMFEAFANSRFKDRLDKYGIKTEFGEYMHCNAARVVTAQTARQFPVAAPGQVLISMPHFYSSLGLLDPATRRVVWLTTGSWRLQHDPDLLDNGHMMLFDNCGNLDVGGVSRVIEFDPLTGGLIWSYHGTDANPLISLKRSGAQRLPNGNTLITESDSGRLLEVTTTGDVVWEFINPVRGGKNGELIPVLSTGERIAPENLDPSFREYLISKQAQMKGIP